MLCPARGEIPTDVAPAALSSAIAHTERRLAKLEGEKAGHRVDTAGLSRRLAQQGGKTHPAVDAGIVRPITAPHGTGAVSKFAVYPALGSTLGPKKGSAVFATRRREGGGGSPPSAPTTPGARRPGTAAGGALQTDLPDRPEITLSPSRLHDVRPASRGGEAAERAQGPGSPGGGPPKVRITGSTKKPARLPQLDTNRTHERDRAGLHIQAWRRAQGLKELGRFAVQDRWVARDVAWLNWRRALNHEENKKRRKAAAGGADAEGENDIAGWSALSTPAGARR